MKTKGKKRITWLTLIFLALIAMALFWPKAPQPPQSVNDIEELEVYLNQLVDFGTPPGISLVVIKKDQIVYKKGIGWADQLEEIKASPETVYHWWSITKIPTAMAIMQLQEQGKLKLDDPVKKYLPYIEVIGPSGDQQDISIRQLLNHSSGIADAGIKIMNWTHSDKEAAVNQTAMLKKVFPDFTELDFEPEAYTSYTNIGYMVLGAIIEELSQQSYEDYIRQHLLEPLQMKQSNFVYTEDMRPYEAAGSHPIFDAWTPIVPFFAGSYFKETSHNQIWLDRIYTDQTPPSGLIGSATDAALLVKAYLNEGSLDSLQILSKESIHSMTYDSYVKLEDNPEDYFVRQGIGWRIYKGHHGLILEHSGGGIGFSTMMQIQPEREMGFILFANSTKCEGWRIIQLASSLDW